MEGAAIEKPSLLRVVPILQRVIEERPILIQVRVTGNSCRLTCLGQQPDVLQVVAVRDMGEPPS
jgi:hypothetical protein